MLSVMREQATSWFIKIILGAIVVVFALWGVGNYGAQQLSKVAAVNGEIITMEQYRNAYNNLVEQYRQMYGDRLDNKTLDMLQLDRQALDGLIEQELIIQQAHKLDFRVADEELASAIGEIGAFQRSGRFDPNLYRRVLSSNRLTPESFEMLQRQSMLTQKLRSFIQGSVKVSDHEARQYFDWKNAEVKIDYVRFDPADFPYEPTEAEATAYFESHRDDYKIEPKAKATYIHFDPQAYEDEVTVSDEEIAAYYDAHPDEFKTEAAVTARHILIKAESDDPPEAVQKKKEHALEIMEKAKAGEDFAELAKTYSEGPSAAKGGELGEFKKGDMVKPFSDKAFSMEPGEISEPVPTRFGWHVIKVEAVHPESVRTLEAATDDIRKKLAGERAETLAYDAAEAVYDATFDGDDLVKIAEARNLTAHETDWFTKSGPGEGIKNRSRFAAAAFDLQLMAISDIKDFGDGYYLIQTTEKAPEKQAPFDDVAEEVRADLVARKQSELAAEAAEAFLGRASEGDADMTAAAEAEEGIAVTTTDFFKREGSIPGIGYEPEIAAGAFGLSQKTPYPETPIKGKQGLYVIRFNARKTPDAAAFQKEKASVKQQLLQQKKSKAFNTWLSEVRARSEIEQFLDLESQQAG
jgi:peptidyl-prolyl cis-trans isomerase D